MEKKSLKDHWGRAIALVSLVAIALGSFNDSTDALEKIYDFSLSQFTDIPSQEKLAKVYVRASADVLDEALGAPVYIKRSADGDLIKYYQDGRFVLSAVIKDDAIAAYLVFPNEGFTPNTKLSAGGEDLLSTPFSDQEGVSDLRASLSRILTYYIEENTGGEFNNLYTSVSGYSEFQQELTGEQHQLLESLVDAFTLGDDVTDSAQALRQAMKPNFYGYSSLGLSALEDAILTKSEYQLIQQ
uniref:Uncharacterized protein n=1 Tax=Vibrio ziniensis TaxID=2711221 RepID=A0A6G7CMK0_9VIBR|nr:hypothetical protein G5S32_13855 [Vibrio ziniensis]